MSLKDEIKSLCTKIDSLKEQTNVSMSLDKYNSTLKIENKKGMVTIINCVLDIINNNGENIKVSEKDVEIVNFINLVKDLVKKGESNG